MSGRQIAEDGNVINVADIALHSRAAVSRGLHPNASIRSAFGERTTAGAETEHPVWPDGDTVNAAPEGGLQMYVVSTQAADAFAGANVQRVDVHYVLDDLTEGVETVDMNGTTPVPLRIKGVRFIQEIHALVLGANKAAAGVISVTNAAGTVTYNLISAGALRSVSSYRMVPKNRILHIDTAVFGSVSGTAAATSVVRLVATRMGGHDFLDPAVFFPLVSVGVQDSTEALYDLGLDVLPAGTIVGAVHTSDKAATITATWSGRLLPATP